MKKKSEKIISSAKLLKYIKEIKNERKEMYDRYKYFKSELVDYENKANGLAKALSDSANKISELNHLIRLYEICDEKRIWQIWEMNKMSGDTTDCWVKFRDNFYKETFEFKVNE
jgi:predicted nuclease with TOPRIM domain